MVRGLDHCPTTFPIAHISGHFSVPASRLWSWAEIRRHNTKEDCMIVIRGKVYAVQDFVKHHPGGEIIVTYAGEDATGTDHQSLDLVARSTDNF